MRHKFSKAPHVKGPNVSNCEWPKFCTELFKESCLCRLQHRVNCQNGNPADSTFFPRSPSNPDHQSRNSHRGGRPTYWGLKHKEFEYSAGQRSCNRCQPSDRGSKETHAPIEITEAYGPPIIWYDRLINLSMRCSTWRGNDLTKLSRQAQLFGSVRDSNRWHLTCAWYHTQAETVFFLSFIPSTSYRSESFTILSPAHCWY